MNRLLALALLVAALIAVSVLVARKAARDWDRIKDHCQVVRQKDPVTGETDYRCDDGREYWR